MQLNALTGLVVEEKNQLATELVQELVQRGSRVALIDNGARLLVDRASLPEHTEYIRLDGDVTQYLGMTLDQLEADQVVLVVSETANPDSLFIALDRLQDTHPQVQIHSFALVDTRTCDCFPFIREKLEMYANTVLMMPVSLEDVREYVT